eukprot:1302047-Pyramimonas_sp.AAC.1
MLGTSPPTAPSLAFASLPPQGRSSRCGVSNDPSPAKILLKIDRTSCSAPPTGTTGRPFSAPRSLMNSLSSIAGPKIHPR